MNPDHERFQICLQCCEEFLVSDSKDPALITFCKSVIEAIESNIEGHWKWCNEVYCQSNGFMGSDNSDEVCRECSYMLEHLVLRETDERRPGKI